MVRAGIDSISINPDTVVFTRELVASIGQRIKVYRSADKARIISPDATWFGKDDDHEPQ